MSRRASLAPLVALVLAAAVLPLAHAASRLETIPPPAGYVSDFAHLLTPFVRAQVEARLADYDRTTGTQIAVATFPTIHGVPINEFASRLEEAWKVGRKGKDNGVLLLVALEEREVRIEVGYGLEGRITDAVAGAIIRQWIVPAFQSGHYDDGIMAATDTLIGVIGGAPATGTPPPTPSGPSPAPPSPPPAPAQEPGGLRLLPVILFLAFLVISVGVSRARGQRCPRCGGSLQVSEQRDGFFGRQTFQAWVCPRCGYREKRLLHPSMWSGGPVLLGGGGAGWGTGGFSAGGFSGFGGGSSGGGGATGNW
jgi:uncharacterized protein